MTGNRLTIRGTDIDITRLVLSEAKDTRLLTWTLGLSPIRQCVVSLMLFLGIVVGMLTFPIIFLLLFTVVKRTKVQGRIA